MIIYLQGNDLSSQNYWDTRGGSLTLTDVLQLHRWPARGDFQLDAIKRDLDLLVRQSVEEELAVGVRRIVLWISRREQPAGLGAIAAVKVVDALAAICSTNSALHLELRC